jgi:hypothetical protein
VGLVLLAINHLIIRHKAWLIGIRLVLAAGLGLLSCFAKVAFWIVNPVVDRLETESGSVSMVEKPGYRRMGAQ